MKEFSVLTKYQKSINALKKRSLFRKRKIYNNSLIDFASNDYLGLATNKKLAKKAYRKVYSNTPNKNVKNSFAQSSMLVSGYSKIHKDTQKLLCKYEGFDKCLIVGSGFLANIALLDSLINTGDKLYIDEFYHASGLLASEHKKQQREFFKHNCPKSLEQKLKNKTHKGISIIAIEGIYSMSGLIGEKKFALLAQKYNCILIVDEAHSSGVLGDSLKGWFDYYNIKINKNHIKLGTFSKAYGSYGAYILSSKSINLFLQNRAKSIIYSTALSPFDCALAYFNIKHINKNYKKIKQNLDKLNKQTNNQIIKQANKQIIKQTNNQTNKIATTNNNNKKTPIHTIIINNNKKVMYIKKELLKKGFLIGAIRQPTVPQALIRISVSATNSIKQIKTLIKQVYKLI